MSVTLRTSALVAAVLAAAVLAYARPAHAQCTPPPGDAFAFLSLGDQRCPATPLVRFVPPEVVFECGFFADGTHEIDCGEATPAECVTRCREAADLWNEALPGRFRFVPADGTVTFCDASDRRTSIGGSDRFCGGMAFGSNIIAVTLRLTIVDGPQRGEQQDADIVLNTAFNDVFTPDLVRAVVAHELGHVLGLDHPDQCGRDANVLMRSAFRFADDDPCFVGGPVTDDVNGAMTIYPVTNPGPTPSPAPVCGDADGNGVVNAADAASVLQAAVGLASGCVAAPVRCDVDAADGIDVIDAANVQRRALGLASASGCAL